jgi:3-phosphoshikimate 1-carboxyvinyltransferase
VRFVAPSQLEGLVAAPPSKSLTQRAVAAALLACGESEIVGASDCDDARAAIGMAKGLGAAVRSDGASLFVTGGLSPKTGRLDAGESGLALRMFSAVAALCDREITLSGRGTLLSRPVGAIGNSLVSLGATVRTQGGYPPITVFGPLSGGTADVNGSLGSQFLTGLLFALPLAKKDSTLAVRALKSLPYIRMTLSVLSAFGVEARQRGGASADPASYIVFEVPGRQEYRPVRFEVEGDWSGAANLLVAGALAGTVSVDGLDADSRQADRVVLDALRAAGADVSISGRRVTAARADLRAFTFDASDCPDLFPPLVALSVHCRGKSAIAGASRLVHKESNRAAVLVSEFSRLGARIGIAGDRIEVEGGPLEGGRAETHGDHRIAMALAVGALATRDGVEIEGSESVSKSYLGFFEDLASIGAKMQ